MPTNEKEINVQLLDQLDMIERLKKALEKGDEELRDQLAMEERQVKRKLYQKPPLTEE